MFLYSRVVVRDAFEESDVQPYREVDMQVLQPPADPPAETEEQPPEDTRPAWEELVAAAHKQAEEIIAHAQHQAAALQQEAYEQGLARGLEDGRAEAKQELSLSQVALVQAGQSLIVLEEQLVSRLTPQLVRLALAIAEKIVGREVAEDPTIVASVLERARAELPQARHVRIWLHPRDHQFLQEAQPDLVWVGEKGGRKVEVLSSEEVDRGGCRVETEMGVVDATIPVQLQEIRRQLLDEEP
jgi:flagellar biosynthesis/type III secretory pathway protein FliH